MVKRKPSRIVAVYVPVMTLILPTTHLAGAQDSGAGFDSGIGQMCQDIIGAQVEIIAAETDSDFVDIQWERIEQWLDRLEDDFDTYEECDIGWDPCENPRDRWEDMRDNGADRQDCFERCEDWADRQEKRRDCRNYRQQQTAI